MFLLVRDLIFLTLSGKTQSHSYNTRYIPQYQAGSSRFSNLTTRNPLNFPNLYVERLENMNSTYKKAR